LIIKKPFYKSCSAARWGCISWSAACISLDFILNLVSRLGRSLGPDLKGNRTRCVRLEFTNDSKTRSIKMQ